MPFTPSDTLIIIPFDTRSCLIHRGELLYCFGYSGFRCPCDQFHCPLIIDFHINPGQIGKTDQEVMFGICVVCFDSHCPDLLQKRCTENLVLYSHYTGRDGRIVFF